MTSRLLNHIVVINEMIKYKATVMSMPGKTTRPSPRGWLASRGKPLGMTFMIGHISLAGMAKGTIQSFVGEKKIPKPMLPIKLSIIVKKVPIFSLIN